MWEYNYTDELYHHGVLGMKWGHRSANRVTNSEYKTIKADKYKMKDETSTAIAKKYKLNEKQEAIYNYGKKHHLDLDDGGGGSSKASQKYMKLWEDNDVLIDRINAETGKKVTSDLVNKYGKEKIDSFTKKQNRRHTAAAVAVLGTLMAIPIGAGVLAGASST